MMKLHQYKCPNCGANIDISNSEDIKCSYCGQSFTFEVFDNNDSSSNNEFNSPKATLIIIVASFVGLVTLAAILLSIFAPNGFA